MELKVEESLMMPAVFHTVASRTQLAVVSKFLLYSLTKGKLDINYEIACHSYCLLNVLMMVYSSEPAS